MEPIHQYAEHLFNGPYKLMHLLLKMGQCHFFQYIRVVCMWVLLTTTIIYATWAHVLTCGGINSHVMLCQLNNQQIVCQLKRLYRSAMVTLPTNILQCLVSQ